MDMKITTDILLAAYAQGLFPMAESRESKELFWFDPDKRGVLPLDGVHVPKRLCQKIRRAPYVVTFNHDFEGVIRGCAGARAETWINEEIIQLYTMLHREGHAHSAEAWKDDQLVGGVYGVSIGGAFFGESMFSVATDASKIALVYLAEHLQVQGFMLFDTQYVNSHILQFGVIEISRKEYHRRLKDAIAVQRIFL
jgi:leucyl/phenylalanyl-tRNA--protein transferase